MAVWICQMPGKIAKMLRIAIDAPGVIRIEMLVGRPVIISPELLAQAYIDSCLAPLLEPNGDFQ